MLRGNDTVMLLINKVYFSISVFPAVLVGAFVGSQGEEYYAKNM